MKNLKNKLGKAGGFTLVEMLIVVAIIAILVAVSIPLVGSSLENSRDNTDLANERAAKAEASMVYLGVAKVYAPDGEVNTNAGTTGQFFYDAASGKLLSDGDNITSYGKCTKNHSGETNAPQFADDGEHEDKIVYVDIEIGGVIELSWHESTYAGDQNAAAWEDGLTPNQRAFFKSLDENDPRVSQIKADARDGKVDLEKYVYYGKDWLTLHKDETTAAKDTGSFYDMLSSVNHVGETVKAALANADAKDGKFEEFAKAFSSFVQSGYTDPGVENEGGDNVFMSFGIEWGTGASHSFRNYLDVNWDWLREALIAFSNAYPATPAP